MCARERANVSDRARVCLQGMEEGSALGILDHSVIKKGKRRVRVRAHTLIIT